MNRHELDSLLDALRRRELTPAEQERLERLLDADPAGSPGWREEQALTRLLCRLPDAPMASNFTAQVMRAIDTEPAPRSRLALLTHWFGGHRPAVSFAASAACLLLVFTGYSQYQSVRREHIVASVARVVQGVDTASEVAQLPPVEMLQDFDAIQGMTRSRAASPDERLLAVLESTGPLGL